jgi:hypothetical protein
MTVGKVTTADVQADVTGLECASPLYAQLSVYRPGTFALVVSTATPLTSFAVPRTLLPLLNVTDPPGM